MRILLTGLIALLIGVMPVAAQQGQHMTMTNGPFVYRVKLPANYKIAPHYHKAIENVTVLSGVFFIGIGEKFDQGSGKELAVGGFVSVPPTHRHFAWAGGEETLIQVHGVGPTDITFVNPADDPRKK